MPEISIYEGESAAKIDYTLTYSQLWSNSAKRGLPVPQADTSQVYFYVNTTQNHTSPWLSLDDSGGASGISWTDATNGKIRVSFPASTIDHSGNGQYYELRIKMADGTYLTVDSGTLNIYPTIVGQP